MNKYDTYYQPDKDVDTYDHPDKDVDTYDNERWKPGDSDCTFKQGVAMIIGAILILGIYYISFLAFSNL